MKALATRLGLLLFFSCSVFAQETDPRAIQQANRLRDLDRMQLDQRFTANKDVPVGQRAFIDYGGLISFNYLTLDNQRGGSQALRQPELTGYFRANIDGAHEIFLRGSTSYRDYTPGDSFDGLGDRWINPDLDRAYYKFDQRHNDAAYKGNLHDENFTFQVGRDLNYWGNGLALAQVLDGVSLEWTFEGERTLSVIGGITPTRTVDIDPFRPDFDHNTRRGFYGLMYSRKIGEHTPYVFALVQRDYNEHDSGILGGFPTRFEYNSNYFGIGSSGALSDKLRYSVEGVIENGNTLSSSFEILAGAPVAVKQTRDSIKAAALDARLDFFPGDERQSRFSSEMILATGDADRGVSNSIANGNKRGTPDHGYNGFGLLNTGLSFSPAVSNLLVLRTGASTFPFKNKLLKKLQIGADFFAYLKASGDAPIDEQTNPGVGYLGWEPDVYLNWQMTSDLTMVLRYGVFFPNGDAFTSDDARQFFFGGITLAF